MATIQIAHQSRSVESYAHKAAKAALAGWFRGAAETTGDFWTSPCGVSFRPNRGAPYWGVWEEYPFVGTMGQNPVWDENDWFDRLEGKRLHGSESYGIALRDCGHRTLERVKIIPQHNRIGAIPRPGCGYLSFYANYGGAAAEIPDGRQPHPTFEELKEIGTVPDAIADVAIQHKGTIIFAFEVVHKHGLTDKKRAFMRSLRDCTTVVLDARWILSQVECPKRLVVKEFINFGAAGQIDGCELSHAW